MILTRDYNHGDYEIRSYEPGELQVNDERFNESIVISSHHLLIWEPQTLQDLKTSNFDVVLSLDPEIFLLGTGPTLIFPKNSLLENMMKAQIGVEVMSTSAACRTFNVLMSENRNVVAALLIR